MLHNIKDNYITSVNNYVQNFDDKSFRKLAGKDFKSWPDPLEETWRLSRLGSLSRKKIEPISLDAQEPIMSKLNVVGSNTIKFINGAFRKDRSSSLPKGVSLIELNETESLTFLSKIKNSNLKNHPSANASLSCTPSIVKLSVDKNAKIEELLEIHFEGGLESSSVHPVLFVELNENSSLSIIERFNHIGSLIMPLQLIEIKDYASLNSIKVFDDSNESYNLAAHCIIMSQKSVLNSFSLIKGSQFTRSETHAYLNGTSAKLNLNGVYISGDKQHHDLTTAIYHNVEECISKQIVRGVLGGESTGVFQGKVKVAPNAQKTDGQQMSKAILISDKASANAKPELEIYADDVVCAHGATVGELDDDQLFYLNSRGISKDKARLILIKAFLLDIISESVQETLHDFIFNEAQSALSSILQNEIEVFV